MTLQEYMRIFRAHWLLIAVTTVLGGALALAWTATQDKVYTAMSSAVITADSSSSDGSTIVGNDAESNVKSYVDIAKSRSVAELAGEMVGSDDTAARLLERVTIANTTDTAVIRMYASAPTPEAARDLANAWLEATTEVVQSIEDSRAAASGGAPAAVGLLPLDSATEPLEPTSPRVKLTVALGLIAGLVVGIVVAVVRASQDRRLRHPSDIEKLFEIPVVGALPYDQEIARHGVAGSPDDDAMKEAVRQLRTNLQFVDVDNPPRVIVVTSALPGDGKSTTVIKLAEAIAEGGRDVVLVDADLRRPVLARSLGLVDAVGLTDVLVGRVSIEDALQPYGPTEHLQILSSGSIPPNPSELLASDAMHTLMYSFHEDTIVLVDSPPLLPVTDAAVLTARMDGALVVARAGRTTIEELEQAIQDLEKVKGRAIGAILDAVPLRGAYRSYRGGYAYVTREEQDADEDVFEPEPEMPAEDSADGEGEPADDAEAEEDRDVADGADDEDEPAEDEEDEEDEEDDAIPVDLSVDEEPESAEEQVEGVAGEIGPEDELDEPDLEPEDEDQDEDEDEEEPDVKVAASSGRGRGKGGTIDPSEAG
ncbi:polysaccharide biosynthesis tyrosine autokinase [Demequina rhizosphaerae]|uniref:polysaccharide biosynthesis tyrosine autokinase n=1 Tax=Demequina rhizosphaerae TaxID=1638985 RepID=UPI000780E3FD|nr:polysaccharide biosynthesis tyrosine autokinase [Demequina rhizosphaerae]